MADTRRRRLNHPLASPHPKKPAGSVCSLPVRASASIPLLNASSCARTGAHRRAARRTCDGTQAGKQRVERCAARTQHAFRWPHIGPVQGFRRNTTPTGTSRVEHREGERRGMAAPSSNILNFFFLSSPLLLLRGEAAL